MGDRNIIIILLLIIIIAGGILGYRKYSDLTGGGIQIGTRPTNTNVTENEGTGLGNITGDTIYDKTSDFLNWGIGSTDAEKFNSNFKKYEGEQTGVSVRLILNDIRDYNKANTNNMMPVEYKETVYTDNVSDIRSLIEINKNYTISLEYDPETQYIQKIIIK